VPFSSAELAGWLGFPSRLERTGWQRREVAVGTQLGDARPLFAKVELLDAPA
jgi:hypothetical protein